MNRTLLSLALALVTLAAVVPKSSAAVFLTGKNYPSGEFPVAAAVADFNNDGSADLASANENDKNVSVFLNEGNGTFAPANTFSVGKGAVEVAAGDLNGDGKADLVVSDGINSVNVLLGNGDGSFGAPMNYRVHTSPLGIAIADLNDDGNLDLAVADYGPDNNSQGDVAILLGHGDGTFAAPVFYRLNNNANRLVAVDLNGDGKLDLAVAIEHFSSTKDSLAILLGNGDGTFQAATTSIKGAASDIAAGDFNGDGKVDLALVYRYSTSVTVAFGNGDGTFQAAHSYPTNGRATTVTVTDLNRDDHADLVFGGDHVAVMLGNGDGTFASPTNYAVGNRFATVGYFNGDQVPDVAAGGGFAAIGVAFGNRDGTLRAPLSYYVGMRIDGIDAADFDGDGKTDVVAAGFTAAGNRVRVFLGNGNGGFTPGPSSGNLTGPFVKAADFNNDGKEDVLVVTYQAGGIEVALGNGDGSFKPFQFIRVGLDPWPVVADFNHDGKPDVAVTSVSLDQLSILFGNGDGTFQSPVTYSTQKSPQSPITGDFNNDGNPDIAVSDTGGKSVEIFLGNSDGTFQAPIATVVPGPIYSAAADVNGDGNLDLVVSGPSLSLLLGNGDGSFQPRQTLSSDSGVVAIADINGDGKLDIAVSEDSGLLDVFLGDGDGTFSAARVFPIGSQFGGDLILQDLNGDGRPEAIVDDLSTGFAVLLNRTKARQP